MRAIDADAIPWMHGKSGDIVVYPDTIAEMPTIKTEYDEEWRKKHFKMSYNQGFVDGYKACQKQKGQTKGNWINENFETIECSNCNHIFDDSILLNADEESFWDYPSYCPNCGAYMKGEQDE